MVPAETRPYVPKKPFAEYKWFFATKAPTEALGEPAVLLGLISRMARIADGRTKYSSEAFADIMRDLDNSINTSVDLSRRVGSRNLMRNSGQYWKLFGLIPLESSKGIITLTPFARKIAEGSINQVDFAASMIASLKLPNEVSYTRESIKIWQQHDLSIHPFRLILQVIRALYLQKPGADAAWMTVDELAYVVVPMAGEKEAPSKIADYVRYYREDPRIIKDWPNCIPEANDKRFLGEFLRFLANFGYLERVDHRYDANSKKEDFISKYHYIPELDYEITELIDGTWYHNRQEMLDLIQQGNLSSAVTQAFMSRSNSRPNQQKFRRELMSKIHRCPITGNDLPSVLQAAHIKPHAYGGPESVDNGLPLRADIHALFDAGLLSVKPIGGANNRMCAVEILDSKVQSNYRELLDKYIQLPDITNMDYVSWRYKNRFLGVVS